MLQVVLISIAVGLIVGILSGALGIGGGTVLVPVFKLIYGLPPIMCTATSLFTIIPTSITGAITHIKNKTCILTIGIAAGLGGAFTSPMGVYLAHISPGWVVIAAAVIILLYSCVTMFKKALRAPKIKDFKTPTSNNASSTKSVQAATHASKVSPPYQRQAFAKKDIFIAICIGLLAGIASGYVGVGGGFILVPLMMQLLHTPIKLTSGTSLIAVMILAIPGTVTQAIYGNIYWISGIFVALGSIPGAFFGASLVKYLPERALRLAFSAFLLIASIMLISEQIAGI